MPPDQPTFVNMTFLSWFIQQHFLNCIGYLKKAVLKFLNTLSQQLSGNGLESTVEPKTLTNMKQQRYQFNDDNG